MRGSKQIGMGGSEVPDFTVIQSCIKDRILNQLELPILVQGGVRGRDNVSNALIHKGNKYFFLTDIEKFFPSIRHFQVYEMLVSNGFSPTVAGIITKLTTYKGRLPQGTPTSTALANLTFCVVDAELSAFCEEYNLTFTRFVDDITISSKKPFKQLSGPIVKIITRHGYSISKKKTAYKIGPTNVTGASVHKLIS
ncbi:MAG: RNA-directed DNA polymerase [Lewinellaceae bacterium]|nr:RNA-directed DNA polymerase [Lewinellaceae bacterium]